MEIKRSGSQPSARGPAEYFTGTVRLDSAWREALAWRQSNHGDDPYRHSGTARRQSGRLDGTGQRRTIHRLTIDLASLIAE